ncbi:MAG TPA: hypothetical protein DEQ30_06010, partial [Porphyromonadaceae bacterium]|nr:hypothetical protein [Porphyromonadaceae bacterium]
MKNINILSIIEAYQKLNQRLFQKLMNGYGIIVDNMKGIKDYELNVVESLVNNILQTKNDISIVDNYYLGYSIPQIGKEFDLLRFGNNYIINIEVKTESTIDKIVKQQEKNKYYLSFLGKDIHIYTYILNENKLYKLMIGNRGNETREVNFTELCNKLLTQEIVTLNNIDDLFNPSDYLVSPFNSPEKFMNGGYFLTTQQEQICKQIETSLLDTVTSFIALTEGAGTGKTLLTYHIAKESIQKGDKVLILHCAQLNNGHQTLKDEWGWNIHMPKYAPDINDYDLIIIDEAQRMYPSQFEKYTNGIRSMNKKCIFSYDERQYLHNNERNYNIRERIEMELSCKPHKLTSKIRTNKEIAYFIKQLFDINKNTPNATYPNIELIYSKDYLSAKTLLQMLSDKGWKVTNHTPGTYSSFHYESYLSQDRDSAHSVIGQEFDSVAIVIDNHFKYDSFGQLIANNSYYSQKQMLYQIITRTRKKLCVVIIDNEMMLNRCLD